LKRYTRRTSGILLSSVAWIILCTAGCNGRPIPDDEDLYLRGESEYLLQNFGYAYEVLSEFVKRSPRDSRIFHAHRLMGKCMLIDGDYPAARDHFRRAQRSRNVHIRALALVG